MEAATTDTARQRLTFDSPQFLHDLFANDPAHISYMEDVLGLRVVTRESWVLLEGPKAAVRRGVSAFSDLETARRNGKRISERDFRLAVNAAAGEGATGVASLVEKPLLSIRGRQPVTARTPQQLIYAQAIESHDITFGLGPAGTGKTYLAMAMAIAALKARRVNRIILTRPAVEAGEALGFLPGDLSEKIAPYLRPLYDALRDMLPADEVLRYLEDTTVEIAPLAYMRGRTLSRAFVILDEAQNTTREQMFMFLTRLGEGSRCVITGDASQNDLKKGISSGLLEAERALDGVEGVDFVRFTPSDVVRHEVVTRVIEAYDRHREKRGDVEPRSGERGTDGPR